jgi:hypothetical protein
MMRRSIAAVISVLSICSCSIDETNHQVTDSHARQALREIVQIAQENPDELCPGHSLNKDACREELELSRVHCLPADPEPRVVHSIAVPSGKGRQGGRLLVLEGGPTGNPDYRTEMFFAFEDSTLKSTVAVYWTGIGFAPSPFGENNSLIAQSACD